MIHANTILKSKKRVGKYEKEIINDLIIYFSKLGFDAIPHARFDLAWGSIISDIDLLLVNNNKLILVEVKSSKDNLARAKKQLRFVEDFVDEVYLATDYIPKKWPSRKAGRIVVTNNKVEVIREPKRLRQKPKMDSLLSLRRESLITLLPDIESNFNNLTKHEIASKVLKQNSNNLKNHLKSIVTCQISLR